MEYIQGHLFKTDNSIKICVTVEINMINFVLYGLLKPFSGFSMCEYTDIYLVILYWCNMVCSLLSVAKDFETFFYQDALRSF